MVSDGCGVCVDVLRGRVLCCCELSLAADEEIPSHACPSLLSVYPVLQLH